MVYGYEKRLRVSDKQLIEIALKKGVLISAQERNGLNIFRAVMVDPQGLADRRAFIARLSTFDEQRQPNFALTLSVVASVIGLVDAFMR